MLFEKYYVFSWMLNYIGNLMNTEGHFDQRFKPANPIISDHQEHGQGGRA